MLKLQRSSVFLPRPISVFEYNSTDKKIKFLIAKVGNATKEFSRIDAGEKVRLTGPFGNSWTEFLPVGGKAALVGGSAGVAPLAALIAEKPDYRFDFYAGFKRGFIEKTEENAMLGAAINAEKIVITAEDGINAIKGIIVDYLNEPESYDVIFGCGSKPMLRALKEKCSIKNVSCYLSMENIMACGAGACLGCTIQTVHGNRRCCADGPIFPAGDVLFND